MTPISADPFVGVTPCNQQLSLMAPEAFAFDVGEPTLTAPPRRDVFQLVDRRWQIRFGSTEASLRNSPGFRYLSMLVAKPNHSFPVAQLQYQIYPRDPRNIDRSNALALDADLTSGGFGPQDDFDLIAMKRYQDEFNNLNAQIDRAESQGRSLELDALKSDKEALLTRLKPMLRGSKNGIGKSRAMPSCVEKARQRVTQAIRRAYVKLDENGMAELRSFFKKSIQTGLSCRYVPPAWHPGWLT